MLGASPCMNLATAVRSTAAAATSVPICLNMGTLLLVKRWIIVPHHALGKGRVASQVEEGLADANAGEHPKRRAQEGVAVCALDTGDIRFIPSEMATAGHPTDPGILKRTPKPAGDGQGTPVFPPHDL